MAGNQKVLLEILTKEVSPALGCTEPVAVAYSVAYAKQRVSGNLKSIQVVVDPGLYKNGIRVGIPGIAERGLVMAAALGYVAGDPEKKLEIFEDLDQDSVMRAHQIIQQDKIKINIKSNFPRLYIETTIATDQDRVRVVTLDHHLNIVAVERGDVLEPFNAANESAVPTQKIIQDFEIEDFVRFADEVPLENLDFLKQGLKMNLQIAEYGCNNSVIGKGLKSLIREGLMSDDMISRAQILCSAASEARMSGVRQPVMSCSGSGNHGLTVFLTNYAVAEKKKIPGEKLLRALALSGLLTAYIKSYTGTLSAMCGCGVAAGIGASAGIVYMLDGTAEQMYETVLNMVGSIAGIICDGGKEGCAYKLALASGWAVQSALLALHGSVVNKKDGILADDFRKLIKNLGQVCNPGMVRTNDTILEIMSCN